MIEPEWNRLPFATDPKQWRAYTELPSAAFALAWLDGLKVQAEPVVWLHLETVKAFARTADICHDDAWLELAQGVLRWWRAWIIADGTCYAVRFHGAPDLALHISRLGNCLLVHLPQRTGGRRQ